MIPVDALKKQKSDLEANQDKYVSGDLDLYPELEKTEDLFKEMTNSRINQTAGKVLLDTQLLQLQTNIVTNSTRKYRPDTMTFNPLEFAKKLKDDLGSNTLERLGKEADKIFNSVPSHNFMFGAFDIDSITPNRRKRKSQDNKTGELTKPQSSKMNQSSHEQDTMLLEAERLYSVLRRYLENSESGVVCFYEFVTDPESFARTIENIFLLSLIVKEGHIQIVYDEHDLPYLKRVSEAERKERAHFQQCQSIISLSMEDWKDIIKAFKITKALIPPHHRRM